ncbi:hypothetical protein EON67_08850, partial [archaeon]
MLARKNGGLYSPPAARSLLSRVLQTTLRVYGWPACTQLSLMERASAFSGGGYDGSTSAFISRLMALCNEHESGVRRDRQRLEAQLAVAQERAEQAESANRARFAEVEALTSQVQRMSVQLDAATSGKDTRMARLETELVRTRFALHARLTQLQDVMYTLQQV